MFPDIRAILEKMIRSKTIAILILLCITSAVYWQVNDHDFINYDDPRYVVNNPQVNSGLSISNFFWAFTSFHESNWHPLTWLSHMLDVQLFGLNAPRHHLINVIFHLVNTALLFVFLNRATGSFRRSSFVAALFALHPLHVESVAWIAERKDVLSTLLLMLALIFYVWYVERPSRSRYLSVLCVFALGLMSKPMLVTLPFVLLLLDYWPLGRMAPGMSNLKRLLSEKVPFLALSAASGIITIYAQWKGGAVAHIEGVPLAFRGANALVAYVSYMWKMIWPVTLAVIYPLPPVITIMQAAVAGLILACITLICLRLANRHPYLIVGWFWYLLTLVPVIGLVQVGLQFIADRYTYIPMIGLFTMFAWGAPDLLAGRRYRAIALSSMACLILSACVLLTCRQVGYWKNTFTLFGHATEAVAGNYIAHNILGDTLVDMGRTEEAIDHFSMSLRIRPEDKNALVGMGVALFRQGRMDEALHYFDRELRLRPQSADGHFHKGFVLMEQGKLDSAISHYREAMRTEPDRVDALMNMGTALIREGKFEEGFRHYAHALEKSPHNAEIRVTVGLALAMEGRIDEGIEHFRYAIRTKPSFADAHYNLGVALARQGKLDEAIFHFRETLRLDPELAVAKSSLTAAMQRNKNQ